MSTQLGLVLRDAALARSREGRGEDIERVRGLLCEFRWTETPVANTLTADDVWRTAEALDLLNGDRRWLAHVTLNWNRVEHTGQYVKSTLPHRHGRIIPVYRWVSPSP